MKKELIRKFLNNQCSRREFEELERWINEKGFISESRDWGYEDWKSFEPDFSKKNDKKYNNLLNKIHHEINLKNNSNHSGKRKAGYTIAMWLSRVAAILFVPMLGLAWYLGSTHVAVSEISRDFQVDTLEIIAPVGSRSVVQLSDGTEVDLNYGSRIKYPRVFTGDYREITLSGEAYFKVAHNPEKPFVVKTTGIQVKALGTEFNVHAYPNDVTIFTTLVKGEVVLEKTINGKKDESIGTMIPGQHVAYQVNSGIITSTQGNIEKYIAWKDGKLVFDNEPITGVAEKLGMMFNTEIEVADEVKHLTYTVTFVNDPLFLILDLMTETTPITYKTFPRKKLPDGTFTKQKIRIEKRT